MADQQRKPRQQPEPNVSARIGGNAAFPWITLRSFSETLVGNIGSLSALLSSIDGGLEIVATDDSLGIRVQPKPGITRSRTDLFTSTRQLARAQSGWVVKWNDD